MYDFLLILPKNKDELTNASYFLDVCNTSEQKWTVRLLRIFILYFEKIFSSKKVEVDYWSKFWTYNAPR